MISDDSLLTMVLRCLSHRIGTVTPRYYVINYYSIPKVNPTGIIPKGTPVDLGQPHDRARLAA